LSLEGEPCGASAPLGLEECTAPAAATRAVALRGSLSRAPQGDGASLGPREAVSLDLRRRRIREL
jgi:hypothetical protein